MAQCHTCNKEMKEADGCDPDRVIGFDDGETAKPIEYGDETPWEDPKTGEERTWSSDPCHDCGASKGHVHHPGCDVEECPRCGGQYLTCVCDSDEKQRMWGGPPERYNPDLIRDFIESDFDAVERDGIMVSKGGGKIWIHEANGVSVSEDHPDLSTHHYELIDHAPIPDEADRIDSRRNTNDVSPEAGELLPSPGYIVGYHSSAIAAAETKSDAFAAAEPVLAVCAIYDIVFNDVHDWDLPTGGDIPERIAPISGLPPNEIRARIKELRRDFADSISTDVELFDDIDQPGDHVHWKGDR